LIKRDKVKVSNPTEVKEQLCYAVANDMRYKQLSFKHAVNRHAKIIASNNWRTPHGFFKYAEIGRKASTNREEAERAAEESKYRTSVPTLPDHFKDLFKLDLSGVEQGSKKVDAGSQIATESEVTATINLSQSGRMGLSPKIPLSTKDRLTTTRPQSRIDVLNESIARYQAKLAHVKGETKIMLMGLIERCVDELKMLRFSYE